MAPEFGDRRQELIRTVMKEECYLSGKYPGMVFYFNRNKPDACLWRSSNFKVVRLGRIAKIDHDDALFTYYDAEGTVRRGYLNLGFARLIPGEHICDAESCGSFLAA